MKEKKRVLITGAANGIGRCIAQEFARDDVELVLVDIDEVGLERVKHEIYDCYTYCCDVSNTESVKDMARKIEDELGGIDVLINNAGIGHNGELANTSMRKWADLININFLGPLQLIYAFLDGMKDRQNGVIVNVSSGQVYFKIPTWGAYTSIKAALTCFSHVLHYELEKYGITVTTVHPFMVDTPFYKDISGGNTWLGKLSMKTIPYYSMSPESVGRKIYKAVKKKKRMENISILNAVGFYSQFIPFVPSIIGKVSALFLTERE